MTATQKIANNECIDRVEVTIESLVREVIDLKQDMRTCFITLLTVVVTMWASLIASLLLIN